MTHNMNIAIILTCFNRKNQTLKSLQALFHAAEQYNRHNTEGFTIRIFLTDDGCTDGTAEAIHSTFPDKDITILQGDGTLYWAGGMRMAWKAAIEAGQKWNFFLLMNDDTILCPEAFSELMATHKFVFQKHGKNGIYSGVCSSSDGKNITYGGKKYSKPLIGRSYTMKPTGTPQPCRMTNANILLVSHEVTETIGIFDEGYTHSCADWAYGIEACKAGFPVYITAHVCGKCDNDYDTENVEKEKVIAMSINERKAFFHHPLRSISDIMTFMRRYNKVKYILLIFARLMNIYMPNTYYHIGRFR